MKDYGYVDDKTPSIAIALLKDYRNYGIGTELMKRIILVLKEQGYKQVSLSVQKMNYAVQMYKQVGFEIVDENNEEYIRAKFTDFDIIRVDAIVKLNDKQIELSGVVKK